LYSRSSSRGRSHGRRVAVARAVASRGIILGRAELRAHWVDPVRHRGRRWPLDRPVVGRQLGVDLLQPGLVPTGRRHGAQLVVTAEPPRTWIAHYGRSLSSKSPGNAAQPDLGGTGTIGEVVWEIGRVDPRAPPRSAAPGNRETEIAGPVDAASRRGVRGSSPSCNVICPPE